jgi:uroporphyrinogen III methyltransferase / synthase
MFVASKPLINKTIFAACSSKKMADLTAGLEALGGTVVPLAVIEAKEIDDKRALDEALLSLGKYSWIIFTSAYGVAFFAKRFEELNIRQDRKVGPKICAVGPATARALKDCGFDTALVPEQYVAEGIIQALDRHCGGLRRLAGNRVLLPRALEARDVLPNALAGAGAQVDIVACYETLKTEMHETTLRQMYGMAPDLMVFTSSSTIKNLMAILGQEYGKKLLSNSRVAVLGPITAKTAESFGKHPEIVPKENTVASLLDAIRDYYKNIETVQATKT